MNATEQKISPASVPGRVTLALLALIFVAGLAAVAVSWGVEAAPPVSRALLWGVLVAAVGSLSWVVVLKATFHRKTSLFLGGVVGGMTLRMVLYGVALLVAGFRGGVDVATLMITLFGSHLAYQAVELLSLHRARRDAPGAGGSGALKRAGTVAAALLLVAGVTHASTQGQAGGHPAPEKTRQARLMDAVLEGEAQGHDDAHGEAHDDGHGEAHGDAHGEHEGFDVLHHVVNSSEIELPFGKVHLPTGWVIAGIDFAPTKHVVFMWLSALLLFVFVMFALPGTGLIPRGLGNFLETLVAFIRDEVARKNIGHHADRFTPFLCTMFFFILFNNLLGLVPFGATATGNLNMTAGLAVLSLFVIQFAGIAENGIVAHVKAFCPIPDGVPGWLLPLYIPIIIAVEVVGIFAKPIALALRLFANMTAGHVVIVSLLGLIFILKTIFVAPVSVAFALFIYCLEVFVGFVQAYIFTMLTALFIGMSQHPAH